MEENRIYVALTVNFDGEKDYLMCGSNLPGAADGKKGWVKILASWDLSDEKEITNA